MVAVSSLFSLLYKQVTKLRRRPSKLWGLVVVFVPSGKISLRGPDYRVLFEPNLFFLVLFFLTSRFLCFFLLSENLAKFGLRRRARSAWNIFTLLLSGRRRSSLFDRNVCETSKVAA